MTTADGIRDGLRKLADPERAEQERRYLKSSLDHLGVPVPAVRKVVVAAVRASDPDRNATLALAEELWGGFHEFRMAALEVLIRQVRLLSSEDVPVAERLIRDSVSWAYVDALAEKIVGGLFLRDPALGAVLDRYVADADFWIRRTALLALLPGVRTGVPDLDRLARYGDLLIGEREFFIRKALGWVLRELSKKDPGWVVAWLEPRVTAVSGVTLREAVRRLPEVDRDRLMAYR